MRGAIPLLTQHASMAWCLVEKKLQGQLHLFLVNAPQVSSVHKIKYYSSAPRSILDSFFFHLIMLILDTLSSLRRVRLFRIRSSICSLASTRVTVVNSPEGASSMTHIRPRLNFPLPLAKSSQAHAVIAILNCQSSVNFSGCLTS
jgi:hypothetical protein